MRHFANAHRESEALARRIEALGPWFHNLRLNGVQTAPDHFLGDYPRTKFEGFARYIPDDLTGKTVLDIGCNAGFYALEMKRRGAERVLGIDEDDRYLEQAQLASAVTGCDVEFRKLSVYDVGAIGERFDVVLLLGVLYHLRHPMLALDLVHEHVSGDMLVFQSLQRGREAVAEVSPNPPFTDTAVFEQPGFPVLHFVERSYADDWTNWWIPNRACSEAMLRAAGFRIETRATGDILICRHATVPYAEWGTGAVYPARGKP
jgi:tRNA (mo5U34)-methyltransferase